MLYHPFSQWPDQVACNGSDQKFIFRFDHYPQLTAIISLPATALPISTMPPGFSSFMSHLFSNLKEPSPDCLKVQRRKADLHYLIQQRRGKSAQFCFNATLKQQHFCYFIWRGVLSANSFKQYSDVVLRVWFTYSSCNFPHALSRKQNMISEKCFCLFIFQSTQISFTPLEINDWLKNVSLAVSVVPDSESPVYACPIVIVSCFPALWGYP